MVSIRTKRRSMKYGSDSTTTGEFVAYSEYFRIEDSDAVIADKVNYLIKLYLRFILSLSIPILCSLMQAGCAVASTSKRIVF